MQYCRGGKKSKRFYPGKDLTERIFTGETFRGGFSRGTETRCLYSRIMLYSRTISQLVLFIFTSVVFGVFDIFYFRFVLKALDIGQFSL